MKKTEMDKIVNEELKHMHREGLDQNELRAAYNIIRRRDLGKSKDTPREESLKRAILSINRDKPNFIASYDEDFFKINEV